VSGISRSPQSKVQDIGVLAQKLAMLKAEGNLIALCHGVFDLVHPGHIRLLEAARKGTDLLVVTVVADDFVNKGPGHPVYNQRLRAETLAALEVVDFVSIVDSLSAAPAILQLKPDVYARGQVIGGEVDSPRLDGDLAEEGALSAVGGRLHVVEDIMFSSTNLLNAYFGVFPPETDLFLRSFRAEYSAEQIVAHLEGLRDLKVLVVGDSIVDEYHFCRPYGMASKSTGLAAQFIEAEAYAGGALAVANHVAGYCDQVQLVTVLGGKDAREEFIRAHLKPNITPRFFFRPDGPTVIKRRFVRPFLTLKLFEIAIFDDHPLPDEVNRELTDFVSGVIANFDLVIIADFGHGMIGPELVDILSQRSSYAALNVQLNSANYGFNVVSKYPHADYVCIDEEETRMAGRARYEPLEALVARLAGALQVDTMTVTRGHNGSITYKRGDGFTHTPVLSREVVDPIGAGDAYLSIASLCACKGYPPELVGFIGNAAGAVAVRIVGNKSSVEPRELYQFIRTLLK